MTSIPAILQSERGLAAASSATSVVLVVVLAYSLASLTWQVVAPAPRALPEMGLPAEPVAERSAASPNHALRIANLHLFGRADQAQEVEEAPEAPETRLNLTLLGVYATGGDDAMAIIKGGGNERFYQIGEAVAGGANLKSVHGDRVILSRNGQLETLALPKSEAAGIELTQAPEPADSAQAHANAGRPASPLNNGGGSGEVNLGRLRKNMLDNPEQLGKMVRATPYQQNGQFVGYRLSPRQNRQLFQKLGLQAGDVVTSVNGIAIDRPDKGLLALQDLIKADQVTLTLLRDGSEVTVQRAINP